MTNAYSCIDIYSYSCLHPLSNERKSIFKSGDLRVWTWVWTWKYLNWALRHYTESVADQISHFANVFVRENVAYGYNIVTTLWRSKVHSRRHFV